MKAFLEEVAADLYARYGEGLSERAVLFASRRARLFFTDALAHIAERPMWQPQWATVDELMAEISGLETADRVRLVTELYKVYSQYHDEPFDKFYFWGDMLLTDFDTIDKYLIDARELFRNIHEIKEIEADISYLSPRQLQILSFWSSLGPEADLSAEKRRFLAIWKTLYPIYERFRARLAELGIAYNGMVQRAAAERIRAGGFSFPEPRRYVVAGFNALTECEKQLFRFLSTAAETDFYWDYDDYYKDNSEQEAGMFVRQNVADFPPRSAVRCIREAGNACGSAEEDVAGEDLVAAAGGDGTCGAESGDVCDIGSGAVGYIFKVEPDGAGSGAAGDACGAGGAGGAGKDGTCGVTHDHMSRPKELTSVAAVSNAVQCKYAAEILRGLLAGRRRKEGPAARLGKETAVVLTDENLLLPLLYALPPEIGRVNVTMGFPLRASLAYTFVERLVELQAHRRRKGDGWTFYHADVTGILAHPYVAECDPALTRTLQEEIVRESRISIAAASLARNGLLAQLFTAAGEWRELSDYLLGVVAAVARRPSGSDDARERVEFLAVISDEITKLRNSLEACDIDLTTEVYASLLRRHLQTLRIPFEGEPLEGVQVMGILETRNLDFEHVILLSMTDDNFPGNRVAQGSFVPYNLRAAFALPTPEHHEGVYAYYFYRLIQRARTVHMLYCAHADDKSTGEPSRYIRQLDYESGIPVRKVEVGVDVNLAETSPIEVPKDAQVMALLERFVSEESQATLSPTAFFRYVACPLRFYFHSVARLQADDEVSEEIDAPMFGTILHAAVQRLYTPLVGEYAPGGTLRAMLRTDAAAEAVGRAINEHFLCDEGAVLEDYTGNLLLVRDIVTRYLRGGVMAYDAAHDGFTVCALEQDVAYAFPFRAPVCRPDADGTVDDSGTMASAGAAPSGGYSATVASCGADGTVGAGPDGEARGSVLSGSRTGRSVLPPGNEAPESPEERSGSESPGACPERASVRSERVLRMKFAGIADRIDRLGDGALRVVDYKTGTAHLDFAGVESLFRGQGKQRLSNILQTLLYAMMLHHTRGVEVEPALYYVRNMNREDYSPQLDDRELGLRGVRYTQYAARFEELLRETLAELYDPQIPFRQCEDADTCKFCDFNLICKR